MEVCQKWCPNCRGMQDFRRMVAAEKAAVREKEGPRYFVGDLWRCDVKGCVRYQPYFSKRNGGDLPEKFREEKAAAPE
jgi:hypothetical protein